MLSRALEQLLLPAECALCHGLLGERDAAHLTCPVCRTRFRPVRPPWCERCGQPEPHFGPCRLCVEWPEALKTVRSAVWLVEDAQQAVHALKYGGLSRIADDLALVMAPLRPSTDEPAALIPIPLAPKRLRSRGYNQSELLARALARKWRIPVVSDLLRRTRETPTQTALTPGTRLANVAGAFEAIIADCGLRIESSLTKSAIRNPQFAFVLVDDVFTTGATLAEAARALEQAGATTIHAVTFARAAIPDFT
ncbi:MAG TPA: ComF family protein [Gemmatimonadales bacterium]|nr:ComF family protein [Gemmatimonadales bacterium]